MMSLTPRGIYFLYKCDMCSWRSSLQPIKSNGWTIDVSYCQLKLSAMQLPCRVTRVAELKQKSNSQSWHAYEMSRGRKRFNVAFISKHSPRSFLGHQIGEINIFDGNYITGERLSLGLTWRECVCARHTKCWAFYLQISSVSRST